MSQLLSIIKYNFKHNALPGILLTIAILLFTPVIFGITAQDMQASAYPLEIALPFIGVVLLTSIFSTENDVSILDTVRSKEIPYIFVCILRIIISFIFITVSILGFVILMSILECEVTGIHALASIANAIFLGGLGILGSAITNNIVIGYMIPVLYYVVDMMGGIEKFTLFSMMREGIIKDKLMFFIFGIIFIILSIIIKQIKLKGINIKGRLKNS